MPPAGFEPSIPASERPQAYTLERAETRIGLRMFGKICFWSKGKETNGTSSLHCGI